MKEIKSGSDFTRILVLDEPDNGGTCHAYHIRDNHPADDFQGARPFADIRFQKGPILEKDVNGCTQEDLLLIVIDRLQSFQNGPFPCWENALALIKCHEALHWLESRTRNRKDRGVEGKSEA